MPNVLHRTTKAFIPGVADTDLMDYPTNEWIHDPDIAPIIGVPHVHWVLEGEKLRPMTKDEIDALPAPKDEAAIDAALAKVPGLPDISKGASDADRLRALELKVFGA